MAEYTPPKSKELIEWENEFRKEETENHRKRMEVFNAKIEREIGLREGALSNKHAPLSRLLADDPAVSKPETELHAYAPPAEDTIASIDPLVTELLSLGVSEELSAVFSALSNRLVRLDEQIARQEGQIDEIKRLVENILIENARDTLTLVKELRGTLDDARYSDQERMPDIINRISDVSDRLEATLDLSTQHRMTNPDTGSAAYERLMNTLLWLRVDVKHLLYADEVPVFKSVFDYSDEDFEEAVLESEEKEAMHKELASLREAVSSANASRDDDLSRMTRMLSQHEEKLKQELNRHNHAIKKTITKGRRDKPWQPR